MLEFCNGIYAVPYQAKNYLKGFAVVSKYFSFVSSILSSVQSSSMSSNV